VSQLAINGGPKIRRKNFPKYNTIGEEEIQSVVEVMKTGKLSQFIGGHHSNHYGGYQVRQFEKEWQALIGTEYAISVNSASSGLIAAVGAIGIEPGDEVIVSPYSMCISATAPLFYGAIPIFADVDPNTFCLSAESIRKVVSKKTKAIIVVDIFGQTYDVEAINQIAEEHHLVIIEDASQAPLATYKGRQAGTLGDIGVFSFNYHKHIHSGEGGIVVTNHAEYAERLALIRNHAEAVIDGKGTQSLTNMVGFNMRLGEIEATILREQIKKLPALVTERIRRAEYFAKRVGRLSFIELYSINLDSRHVYYKMILKYQEEKIGVHRDVFIDAVKAELMPFDLREDEGVNLSKGYVKPLYLLPLFQQQQAFGREGYPFTLATRPLHYEKGTCPVVEEAYEQHLICHEFIHNNMTKADIDDVVAAFEKVWIHRDELSKVK